MDFTEITNAIDITSLLIALTALAVIKILPGVYRWAYNHIINWIYPIDPNDPNDIRNYTDEYYESETIDDPDYLAHLKQTDNDYWTGKK